MAENKKNHSRKSVRINIMLPVKYRKFTGNPIFRGVFNVGKTHDLSLGGIKMTVGKAILPNTKLDLEMELGNDVNLYLAGKVISGEDKIIDGVTRRLEKVSFINPDESAQDLLMKFIFNSQRLQLRKKTK